MHTTQVSSFALWYGGHSRLPHRALIAYNILPYTEDSSPPTIDSAPWSTQINSVAEFLDSCPAARSPWYWRFQPGVHTLVPGIMITERSIDPLHTAPGHVVSDRRSKGVRSVFCSTHELSFASNLPPSELVEGSSKLRSLPLQRFHYEIRPWNLVHITNTTLWNAFCKCKASIVSYPLKR